MRPSYRWVRWCSGTLHGGHGKPSSHWCFFLITRSAGGGGKREKRSSVKAAHSVTHLPPTAHSWGRAGGRRLASGEGRPGLLSPKESLGFRAARRPSESNLISPPRPPRLAQQGSASSDAGTGLLGEEAGVRTLPSSGGGDGPRRTRGLHVDGGHRVCGRSGRPEVRHHSPACSPFSWSFSWSPSLCSRPFPVSQRFQSPSRHSALTLQPRWGHSSEATVGWGWRRGCRGRGRARRGAWRLREEPLLSQKGQWNKGAGLPERQYKARQTGTAASRPEEIQSAFLLRVSQETAEPGRRQVGGDAPAASSGCGQLSPDSHTETADLLGEAQRASFACFVPISKSVFDHDSASAVTHRHGGGGGQRGSLAWSDHCLPGSMSWDGRALQGTAPWSRAFPWKGAHVLGSKSELSSEVFALFFP